MTVDAKMTWTIYPIAWDSYEEEYLGSAVGMNTRLHFAKLEFRSYAEALTEAMEYDGSFIINAEISSDQVEAFLISRDRFRDELMVANSIPSEVGHCFDFSEREFSQTVLR